MNLMCDESVERPVVERLRADGHSVVYVAELSPGITDHEVLVQANTLSAALVTNDKDFGELVYRQRRVHSGVVLTRLAGLSNDEKAAIVSAALAIHGAELVGAFSVVSPGQVRIRKPRNKRPV